MSLTKSTADISKLQGAVEKASGKKVSDPLLKSLLHEAVLAQNMWRRQRSASTKTRSEVHGTTKKSIKQKGTGGARHGALTAPIFVGGGVAFGPRPVKTNFKMNKKAFRGALLESLRARLSEGRVLVVSGDDALKGKTKEVVTFLKDNSISKALLCAQATSPLQRAARNLARSKAVSQDGLNPYDVLAYEWLVITKPALEHVVEKLAAKGN